MDKIETSVNVITGEVTQTVSPFTAEELANSAALLAEQNTKQEAAIAIKDSATSKLKALGLTDDEISALKGTL